MIRLMMVLSSVSRQAPPSRHAADAGVVPDVGDVQLELENEHEDGSQTQTKSQGDEKAQGFLK